MKTQRGKSDLLSVFRQEADMHIQELNKGLLELEKSPQNNAVLREVRRRAHTLKGAARMMELMEISSIAHTMEDLLEKAPVGSSELDRGLFDRLFQCLDSISNLLDSNGNKSAEDRSAEESVTRKSGSFELIESFAEAENDASTDDEHSKPRREDPAAQDSILVRTDKLDSLANLISEMLIDQMKHESQIKKVSRTAELLRGQIDLWSQFGDKTSGLSDDRFPFLSSLPTAVPQTEEYGYHNGPSLSVLDDVVSLLDSHKQLTAHRRLLMDRLQDDIRSIRLVPISTVFNVFPRTIRDLGREYGKKIELDISGGEVELDKGIIDTIKDPLMHLVRNAVDHGIEEPAERLSRGKPETGRIGLSAHRNGSEVVIQVSDDGAGIDLERVKQVALQRGLIEASQVETIDDESVIQIIFTSGFSTSPIISDVSGRGVGMDVVVENISRKLKGAVNVDTEPGRGTNISLIVPVTLTIMRGLIVMVGQEMFAIPTRSIEKNIKVPLQQIKSVEGKQVILDSKRIIPLVRLSDVLGVEGNPVNGKSVEDAGEVISVVVIDHGQKQIGFCVDRFGKEQEMVVKGLGSYLKGVPTVAGVTVLAGGEVVPILHIPDLMVFARSRISPVLKTQESLADQRRTRKPSILIVDDSITTRELERSILEASGYDVHIAIDGLDGLNKVAERKFDLIISDIQMPRVDGFRMVEELKQDNRYSHIPVIMVTALQKDEEKRRGIEVGASAYIVKSSFDQTSLLETIQMLIG